MKLLHLSLPFEVTWRSITSLLVMVAVLSLLLFGRLDTLLPGYSVQEVATARQSQSIQIIRDNPIQAPYKMVAWTLAQLTDDPLLATRLAAGFFGAITAGLFYLGMQRWHSGRVAFFATVLFVCSGWFLYNSRLGTPDIMFSLSVLLLATAGYWLASPGHSKLGSALAIIALSLSIYTPGVLWIIILALMIRRGKDVRQLREQFVPWQLVLLAVAVSVVVFGPLVWSFVHSPALIKPLLGLPSEWPNVLEFLKHLLFVPLSVMAYTGADVNYWIARLPLLDAFTSILVILGIYYYAKHQALDRAKLLVGFLVLASILIALNGTVTMALLLPAVYVLVAGGIALLLGQWYTVFPRNPVAQNIGLLVITLTVGVSMFYNMRAYFVAWPNTAATEIRYTKTEKDLLQ